MRLAQGLQRTRLRGLRAAAVRMLVAVIGAVPPAVAGATAGRGEMADCGVLVLAGVLGLAGMMEASGAGGVTDAEGDALELAIVRRIDGLGGF